jgi:hypothetical protein
VGCTRTHARRQDRKTTAGRQEIGIPRSSCALGFGLGRDRPLHLLRQVHLLDLHLGHLDAPGLGLLVEDGLEPHVELLALREEVIQLDLAQHGAERRLRRLFHGEPGILDLDDGLGGADDGEVDHGIHFQRDVVPRDDVLRPDLPGHDAQGYPDEGVDGSDDEHEARPPLAAEQSAQAKDDHAIVLAQDVQAFGDPDREQDDQEAEDGQRGLHE